VLRRVLIRKLSEIINGEKRSFLPVTNLFEKFLSTSVLKERLNSVNPIIIPRNHLTESAIDKSHLGDFLHQFLSCSFEQIPGNQMFYEPPKPHEKIKNTFCGT
jgi:uncharacterized protein YdiU (UPF0061 family)